VIGLCGPLATLYRQARQRLTNSDAVIEAKHSIWRPLGWRTRGQATLKEGPVNLEDADYNIVLAKAGIYTPDYLTTDADENAHIVELFMNRSPNTTIRVARTTGVRDMIELDTDLVRKRSEKTLNMEFDWKRAASSIHTSSHKGHIAFNTRPWETIDQFTSARELWLEFQERIPTCLKSVDDFKLWSDFAETFSISQDGAGRYLRTAKGTQPDLARLRLLLCCAWHENAAGLHKGGPTGKWTAREFSSVLKDAGIPCKKSDVHNALYRAFAIHTCPPTDRCKAAIARLKVTLPDLVEDDLFASGDELLRIDSSETST
jgi:hypothetical protein